MKNDNMKILSFDVGIKNLAYCLLDTEKLTIDDWNIINISVDPTCDHVNKGKCCDKTATKMTKDSGFKLCTSHCKIKLYKDKKMRNVPKLENRMLSLGNQIVKKLDEKDSKSDIIVFSDAKDEVYADDLLADLGSNEQVKIESNKEEKIKLSLIFLKNKAKTLEDIYNNSKYIIFDEVNFDQEDLKLIDNRAKRIISAFSNNIKDLKTLNKEALEPILNNLIKAEETNFKGVGQPLRIALTGSKFGPGVYDIFISLGKEEVQKRLGNKIFR
jgi:glutamyl/glutaminyl-tRNA synthetase